MPMLHGHAGMLASNKRRRVISILVLVNVGLVVVAALWRHAAADDLQSTKADAADQSISAPQTELPETGLPETGLPESELPAVDTAPTLQPPPVTHANQADDPVMEELRNVIRDPNSGLDIPRLDETSPLTARAEAARESQFDAQLHQRIESMHALSAAAVALAREARSLSNAGQAAESAVLMQHAAQLREMIAALAAG